MNTIVVGSEGIGISSDACPPAAPPASCSSRCGSGLCFASVASVMKELTLLQDIPHKSYRSLYRAATLLWLRRSMRAMLGWHSTCAYRTFLSANDRFHVHGSRGLSQSNALGAVSRAVTRLLSRLAND